MFFNQAGMNMNGRGGGTTFTQGNGSFKVFTTSTGRGNSFTSYTYYGDEDEEQSEEDDSGMYQGRGNHVDPFNEILQEMFGGGTRQRQQRPSHQHTQQNSSHNRNANQRPRQVKIQHFSIMNMCCDLLMRMVGLIIFFYVLKSFFF
jgi:hypothetical protein